MTSSRSILASALVIASLAVIGCGDDDGGGAAPSPTSTPAPTATATPTPSGPEAPVITFFGVTRADDRLVELSGYENGVPVFSRSETIDGGSSGFSIVIEAAPGSTGAPIGTSSYDVTLVGLPDLQIQVDRPLGNGSVSVCDDPMTMPGGVPAIDPPTFDSSTQTVSTINDFACRFVDGQGDAEARTSPQDSCVAFASGDFAFVDPESTTQYCGAINVPLAFPVGDTLVSARVRDTAGNVSDVERILIRVVPLP